MRDESPLIAASILAADFARLGEEVRAVDQAGADWLHLDVMDGHFVPNLSIGPQMVRALRPHSAKPFVVHLMIEPYEPYLDRFATAGADLISIHAEAGPHLMRGLQTIRDLGKQAGVAINPGTPVGAIEPVLDLIDLVLVMTVNPGFGGQTLIPSTVGKVRQARALITGRPVQIEVDGGVDEQTAPDLTAAGADVLVAGSAIFGAPDYAAAIARLRAQAVC